MGYGSFKYTNAGVSIQGRNHSMYISWLCGLGLIVPLTIGAAERALKLSDFSSAEKCGACHVEIYQQWRTSIHSQAATDPVFWKFFEQAARDLNDRAAGFCLTCHAPIASVTKEIRVTAPVTFPLDLPALGKEGVTCDFCHTISGNENLGKGISVGSYRYPRKGKTDIKYGAHADARTTNHVTQVSEFLKSPELCGICHKFSHPTSGEMWQDTYAEWKSGPYAKLGIRCQDCHMPQYMGKGATDGVERTDLHAHVFPGGHTEMVQKVAHITLWAQAKEKSGKSNVSIKALVTNVGSGHLMPTGMPGIRQMWLEVVARNAKGDEVFTNKSPIGIELLGGDGKPTMPWNAVRIGKDTRIGPRKTRQTAMEFTLPDKNFEPLEVKGSVYYRSISELAAQAAGIKPSPALEIATDRVRVFANGKVKKIPTN